MKSSAIFETLRIIGVVIAIYYGYSTMSLNVFTPIYVLSLSGLTGIEGIFFGATASDSIGRSSDRPYQLQSAVNNLSIAITAIIVLIFMWGKVAQVTISIACLTFFTLSSAIHAWEIFAHKNKVLKNIFRPILTLAMLIAVIPLLILSS